MEGCLVGITSQAPQLRASLNVEESAGRLENFLRVSTKEIQTFARLTRNDDIHKLAIMDLCTTNSEILRHSDIARV